jgi:magnesium chelatase subunit D
VKHFPLLCFCAQVLLPPTRSISLAKSRLDVMPCGGGSPLAHALAQSVRTGLNAMSAGQSVISLFNCLCWISLLISRTCCHWYIGDVGRCVIVLISDGRANIPLDVSVGGGDDRNSASPSGTAASGATPAATAPGAAAVKLTDAEKKEQRARLKDEVLTLAGQIGTMPAFKLLVIDTENKFVSTGMAKEIADAAGGRYHFIPKASATAMKQVTVEAVSSLKKEQMRR